MDRTRRHARGLVIAIGVLAVSAGLVAAHEMPAAADHRLGTAADAAAKTVPAVHGQPDGGPHAAQDESEQTSEESAGERPANHGWFVSEAAKADTPDGYETHGEYVSSVAKGGQGKPEAAAAGLGHAAAAPGRATSEAAKAKDGKGKPGS